MDDSNISVVHPLLESPEEDGNMSPDKINVFELEVAEEPMPASEYRKGDKNAAIVAYVGVSILAFVTWVLVLASDPVSLGWYAFHPTCQTLAIVLFTFGVLTLQPTSQPKTKAAGLARHQLIMLGLAFPIISFGTWAIIHNKNLRDAAHFKTWHGTFGIITYAWIVGQIAIGAGSVWAGGTLFGGGMRAKAVWKYHRLSGYVFLFFLFATVNLGGMFSKWAVSNAPTVLRILVYTLAPCAILGSVYLRVRTSKMKFL